MAPAPNFEVLLAQYAGGLRELIVKIGVSAKLRTGELGQFIAASQQTRRFGFPPRPADLASQVRKLAPQLDALAAGALAENFLREANTRGHHNRAVTLLAPEVAEGLHAELYETVLAPFRSSFLREIFPEDDLVAGLFHPTDTRAKVFSARAWDTEIVVLRDFITQVSLKLMAN